MKLTEFKVTVRLPHDAVRRRHLTDSQLEALAEKLTDLDGDVRLFVEHRLSQLDVVADVEVA